MLHVVRRAGLAAYATYGTGGWDTECTARLAHHSGSAWTDLDLSQSQCIGLVWLDFAYTVGLRPPPSAACRVCGIESSPCSARPWADASGWSSNWAGCSLQALCLTPLV